MIMKLYVVLVNIECYMNADCHIDIVYRKNDCKQAYMQVFENQS